MARKDEQYHDKNRQSSSIGEYSTTNPKSKTFGSTSMNEQVNADQEGFSLPQFNEHHHGGRDYDVNDSNVSNILRNPGQGQMMFESSMDISGLNQTDTSILRVISEGLDGPSQADNNQNMYGQGQMRNQPKGQNGNMKIDSILQTVPEVGSNSGRESDNIAMAGHYMDVNIASAMKKSTVGNDKNN